MDEIIGKGLEWITIFELFFYLAAFLVPMALPLATLLASLMTYGSLGENSELVVIKASGTSLIKAMKGNILIMILLTIGAFIFSNYYLPYATLKSKILLYDIQNKSPTFKIKENLFYTDLDGYSIRVGSKKKDNKGIENVLIYDYRTRKGNDNVLKADSGRFESFPEQNRMVFKLKDGVQFQEIHNSTSNKEYPHSRIKFKEWEKVIDISNFKLERTQEKLFTNHYQMLNLQELNIAIDSLINKKNDRINILKGHLDPYLSFLKKTDTNSTIILSMGAHKGSSLKVNSDSILINYNNETLKKAISTTRSIKGFADFADKDMTHKDKLIIKHEVEWHRKFTIAISCLVFFFMGAPLGAIIRKGGFGYPFIITLLLYVLYHIISISGEKMAINGLMSSSIGMWLGIFCFLPFSLLLTMSIAKENLFFRSWVIRVFKALDISHRIKSIFSQKA
jgi:lipopolysaccharide export system permease protein